MADKFDKDSDLSQNDSSDDSEAEDNDFKARFAIKAPAKRRTPISKKVKSAEKKQVRIPTPQDPEEVQEYAEPRIPCEYCNRKFNSDVLVSPLIYIETH